MEESKQNSLKKVIFKINFKDVSLIKKNLKRLQERYNELHFDSIRIGHLGDDTILSFRINEDYYRLVVDKLESVGASSLTHDTVNMEKQKQYTREQTITPPVQREEMNVKEKKKKSENPIDLLDDYIDEGEFEKVLQISKNVKLGFDVIKKSKNNLNKSVENAIKKHYNRALLNKTYLDESISELLKICSHNSLRTLDKIDLMTDAGLKAIELCTKSEDNYADLIKIANNNSIPSMVVIKAAAKFSEMVFYDTEKYNEDLLYAIKYLNTRWILIAVDVVEYKLTVSEKLLLKNLLKYIEENR